MVSNTTQNSTTTRVLRFLQEAGVASNIRSISSEIGALEEEVSMVLHRLEKSYLVTLAGLGTYKLTAAGRAWPKQVREENVAPGKTVSKMDSVYSPPAQHYREGSEQAEKIRSKGF